MPGTTLGVIKLQALSRKGAVYDTPGIHLTHRLTHFLSLEELASLHPTRKLASYVPPTPFDISKQKLQRKVVESLGLHHEDLISKIVEDPVDASATYFWGGLARIDILQAPPSLALVFVGTKALKAHAFSLLTGPDLVESDGNKVYDQVTHGKMNDELVTTRFLDLEAMMEGREDVKKPMELSSAFFGRESVTTRGGLSISREFEFQCNEFDEVVVDITISGLPGWITAVLQKGNRKRNIGVFKGRIWTPKGIEVFLRPPIPMPNPLDVQEYEQ
eukprot:g3995.t1